jgi:MYST family zinc finger domain
MAQASPLQRARENMGRKSPSAQSRNIQNVVLGDVLFKTWYPSFYPEDLVSDSRTETERLYVCRWCFKYSKEIMPYMAHVVRDIRVCSHDCEES